MRERKPRFPISGIHSMRRRIDEVGGGIGTHAIALMNMAEGMQNWLLLQNCLIEVSAKGYKFSSSGHTDSRSKISVGPSEALCCQQRPPGHLA